MAQGNVILGSGDLYIAKFTSDIPAHEALEVDENKIGSIKGGASLSVSPEVYEVIDDKGLCLKRFITKQEITFKSGILTWDLDTLKMLTLGGNLSSDQEKKTSTLKIGANGSIEQYLIRFVHKMDNGKKIRVTIVGTASAGFELKFNPEEETVIDAEFKAMAFDEEGNQVIIEQETEE